MTLGYTTETTEVIVLRMTRADQESIWREIGSLPPRVIVDPVASNSEVIVMRMTRENYESIMRELCSRAGQHRLDPTGQRMCALINRVCAGDPGFTPYDLPKGVK
jgi:hypothetical protein